jgi:hypothetical protein
MIFFIGKGPLIFWNPRWGRTMHAQGYIDHILPILNEFFEQNPEKMLVEDSATPHAAISSKNARST